MACLQFVHILRTYFTILSSNNQPLNSCPCACQKAAHRKNPPSWSLSPLLSGHPFHASNPAAEYPVWFQIVHAAASYQLSSHDTAQIHNLYSFQYAVSPLSAKPEAIPDTLFMGSVVSSLNRILTSGYDFPSSDFDQPLTISVLFPSPAQKSHLNLQTVYMHPIKNTFQFLFRPADIFVKTSFLPL